MDPSIPPHETAAYLTDVFLQQLVRVHRLCLTPPPEYPDILQSQLLVLSRTYGTIAERLQENPQFFASFGHTDLFHSCLDDCSRATGELKTALSQYESVAKDEDEWNQLAKPTVIRLQHLISAITPCLRLAASHRISKNKHFLDRLTAVVETLNDNDSTLTGQTLNGPEEKFNEKDLSTTEKSPQISVSGSFLPDWEIYKQPFKQHGTTCARLFYRVLEPFYLGKIRGPLALHKATERGSSFHVNRLLYNGAKTEAQDAGGKTALHYAVSANKNKIGRILIKWDANVDAKDNLGISPLLFSITLQNRAMAQLLLDSGANAQAVDQKGQTAVHRAAKIGQVEMLKALLSAGADANESNNDLICPLHTAVIENKVDIVRQLLAAGANVNSVDLKQDTALHMAVRKGHKDIVKLLMEKGADIDALGLRWETPLMSAIMWGRLSILKLLINAGADCEIENTEKHRALHFAVFWNRWDMIKELLNAGALVDPRGRFGETPLTLACQDGYLFCAVKLLAAGASTLSNQSSPRGIVVGNALACARKWARSQELIGLLEKLDSGEIKKVVEEDFQATNEDCRDLSSIKDWMGKFIVQVYERENREGKRT